MNSADDGPIFGTAPADAKWQERRAAYVVIRRPDGKVAAVRGRDRLFLPGGGSGEREQAEETVVREVAEELGRRIGRLSPLGYAIEYFYASDDGRWYKMRATFFRAELTDEILGSGEYEIEWVSPRSEQNSFFHASHAWAASVAESGVGWHAAQQRDGADEAR
jgi:8-oxo-dGTP diphosphatase